MIVDCALLPPGEVLVAMKMVAMNVVDGQNSGTGTEFPA
jgi:hypothetical protein